SSNKSTLPARIAGSHFDNSTMTFVFSLSVSAETGPAESNGTPIFSYGTAKSTYVSFCNQYLVARTAGERSVSVNAPELHVVPLSIFDEGCSPRLIFFSEEEPGGNCPR